MTPWTPQHQHIHPQRSRPPSRSVTEISFRHLWTVQKQTPRRHVSDKSVCEMSARWWRKKKKVKLTCLFHVYLFKVVVGAEVSLSKLEAQLNGWSFPLVSLRVRHRGTCSSSNDALYSQLKIEILQAADQFIDLFWGLYVYLHVCPFVWLSAKLHQAKFHEIWRSARSAKEEHIWSEPRSVSLKLQKQSVG